MMSLGCGMSSNSSSQQQAAPVARTGVSEMDYSKFVSQGLNLASGSDLLGLSVRKENLVQGKTTTSGGGIDIFGWHPGEKKSTEFF